MHTLLVELHCWTTWTKVPLLYWWPVELHCWTTWTKVPLLFC